MIHIFVRPPVLWVGSHCIGLELGILKYLFDLAAKQRLTPCCVFGKYCTLPETNIATQKFCLGDYFPFGKTYFQGLIFGSVPHFQSELRNLHAFIGWSSLFWPNMQTRWWFQVFFSFHPYLGNWSNFDVHIFKIFQMGWFNHQPEKVRDFHMCLVTWVWDIPATPTQPTLVFCN